MCIYSFSMYVLVHFYWSLSVIPSVHPIPLKTSWAMASSGSGPLHNPMYEPFFLILTCPHLKTSP